jgi:hypothetical protein
MCIRGDHHLLSQTSDASNYVLPIGVDENDKPPSASNYDRCDFQIKPVAWSDFQSVQANAEQFSKLLFVPCICHRLQNAIVALFQENEHCRVLIKQAREGAVFLRKPQCRGRIGEICPGACPTVDL